MKCPKCDREINDDNIYCPYCGSRVVKSNEQILKEIKNLRRVAFIHVFNRILNISTFAAVIFMIIGLFGPILIDDSLSSNGIGGLSWFAFDGWRLLNNGVISIGPFITESFPIPDSLPIDNLEVNTTLRCILTFFPAYSTNPFTKKRRIAFHIFPPI